MLDSYRTVSTFISNKLSSFVTIHSHDFRPTSGKGELPTIPDFSIFREWVPRIRDCETDSNQEKQREQFHDKRNMLDMHINVVIIK